MALKPLTEEQRRILVAIADGRFSRNAAGRYVIAGEDRPDRKSRERLCARGLIEHYYRQGYPIQFRVSVKGKELLDA